jgi:diphosphomevalonate decarboxylase
LFGGYVAWNAGSAADGLDSAAEQVAPAAHWPSMRALILVVSAAKKSVPSTEGMQTTVRTSTLFALRPANVVPQRMVAMREAILAKDFERFGKITMQDSNSFHATCLDTDPPIFYMNDVSRAAIRAVEGINREAGKTIAAYTFDAGPNAVVYYLAEEEGRVAGAFKGFLGGVEGWESQRGQAINGTEYGHIEEGVIATLKEGMSKVILTGVGEGPMKVDDHLVDEKGEIVSM